MSHYQHIPQPTTEPDPQPEKKPRRWLVPTVAGVAGLILGVGISTAGADEPEPVAAEPEVITETVTEEVEVPVEVTPQVCLDALDYASEGFDHAADALAASAEATGAASRFDVAGIERANDDIVAATDRLEGLAPLWISARAECREAAS